MNRDIKFRAWDKVYSLMNYQVQVGNTDRADKNYTCNEIWVDYPEGIEKNARWMNADDNCIELMQYTGLKDKNGKEIYEGDLLEDNWQIHFYRGMFVAVRCGSIPNMDNSYQIFWVIENEHCVIGNIYENPQLLKP
jgi:uncharacterized phage protein (TIGR01671 family)